jgi:hypothetical protein
MAEHATEAVLESHGHAAEPPHGAAGELRFEKSELEFFVEDDRYAGTNIGKLLALTFLVLLGLMSFVAWWTGHHQYTSQDPHHVETLTPDGGGH